MKPILYILDELESNNSRLFKESVLEIEKNNELLKTVFRYALDPLKQFHIRKIPKYEGTHQGNITLNIAIQMLDNLSKREFTGKAGIEYLYNILDSLYTDDAVVIERIIGKDLRCGASTATVNKTWPGLISEYPCMLASTYDKKLIDKIEFPAYAQLKSDGMRCNIHYKDGVITYYSRNGKILDLLNLLDDSVKKLVNKHEIFTSFSGVVLDGELMVLSEDMITFLPRKEGNGIITKCQRGTITIEEASRLVFVVWDFIPLDKFSKSDLFNFAYCYRFECLKTATKNNNKIRLIQNTEVLNLEEAVDIYNQYITDGFEGIILKDKWDIWENKRSKSQIKFKNESELDLKITEIQEGVGKYVGMVGSLICETECKTIKVNVGSGLKDSDRTELWKNKPIGKIVSVKYNEVITNALGEKSLFLPVFVEIRNDKEIADIIVK